MITHSKNIDRTEIIDRINLNGIYFMARVGTKLIDQDGNSKDIIGFSLSKDKNHSLLLATYEMYERFWAVYPVACGVPLNKSIECIHYKNGQTKKVLLSKMLPSFGRHISKTDSTGFSFRHTLQEAYEHGVLEVCERHLLENTWYSKDFLIQISSVKIPELSGTLSSYMVEKVEVPFIISFFISDDKSLISAGSSVKNTLNKAIQKSEEEALMVAFSQSKNYRPAYTQTKNVDKYKNLSAKTLDAQLKHIISKTKTKSFKPNYASNTWDTEKIMTAVFGKDVDPLYCILHEEENEYVVRVMIEGAKTPRNSRDSSVFTIDPFN